MRSSSSIRPERIVDEGMPEVNGRLSPVLKSLLSDQGLQNLEHPQLPWTASEALDDLYFLMNRNVPAGAVPRVTAPSAADARRVLAGSPGSLAAWCPPCREEFPLLAAASAQYGRKVAFLGADTNDSAVDARSFLTQHPVSYPSYPVASTDLSSLAVLEGFPTTIFLNRAGKVVFVHTGQYQSEAASTTTSSATPSEARPSSARSGLRELPLKLAVASQMLSVSPD